MLKKIQKFISQILLFTVIIGFVSFLIFRLIIPHLYFTAFPFVLLIVLLITIGFHAFMMKSTEDNPNKFGAIFMLATGAKIFIYLIGLVIYLFTKPQQAVIFLISFLVLYASYSSFEVVALLRYFRKLKKENDKRKLA